MVSQEEISFLSQKSIHFQLDNGLSILFLPVQNTDVLALQMWVKTGSIHEGRFLGSGISHFVEHMVFKGTEKRTYGQIFKETQAQGAKINAYTSFDRTVYTYDGCTQSLDTGLDILGDMLQCSIFDENELNKERDVILREIDMCNDDPDDRLSQILFKNAFQKHPYHYPIIGIRNIFKKLTCDDLLAYWKERYAINNMTLVIAGNLELSEVKDKVQHYLGNYLPRSVAPIFIPQEPFQLAQRNAQDHGDYQLSRGTIAYKIPGIGHKDSAKLQVLASVLGSGESSLLYQKLREELHIIYNIDASSWMADGQGLFWIQYTCDSHKKAQVESYLQTNLAKLSYDHISEQTIQKAYNQAIISELDTQKTVSGQAHHIGWANVCLGDENYTKHYLEELRNLTPDAVKSIIGKYFKEVSCTHVSLDPYGCSNDKHFQRTSKTVSLGIQEITIEGVRVLVQHCDHFPKTNIQALFAAGSLYETNDKRGLTQLLATLLTKDTQHQSTLEIAESIERIGGQFNSFSGNNHFGLSVEVLSKDIELACHILKNALTEPAFLPDTFTTEKNAQLAELQEMQDDVFYVGFQKIRQQFFQQHPYCIGQLGCESSIPNINLEDCIQLYKQLVCKNNCILSVSTSLSQEEITNYLSPLCQALKYNRDFLPLKDNLSFKPLPHSTLQLNKEQAMVFQAYPIDGMIGKNFYASEFLEELFNGLSSFFVEEVREKRGLAYTVGATRLLGLQTGMFCLFAGTQREAINTVEQEMFKCIKRVLDQKITRQEFEICRTCLNVNHQLRLQTIGRKAFQVGYHCLLGLPLEQWNAYEQHINSITLDEFFENCRQWLSPSNACTLLITPKLCNL